MCIVVRGCRRTKLNQMAFQLKGESERSWQETQLRDIYWPSGVDSKFQRRDDNGSDLPYTRSREIQEWSPVHDFTICYREQQAAT